MRKGNQFKIMVFIACFTFTSIGVRSQYSQVINKDTVRLLRTSVFHFVSVNLDSFNLRILKKAIGNNQKIFPYQDFHSSKDLFIMTLQNPFFKDLVALKPADSILTLSSKEIKKIRFVESSIKKYKRLACYFYIYPIVSDNNFFYFKLVCESKNINADELKGEIYFKMNKNFEVINYFYLDKYY